MKNAASLYSAQELEELLGKRYFYRQGIYRLAEEGKISSYQVEGIMYFSSQDVALAALKRLATRIRNRYPHIRGSLRVRFDEQQGKAITIYGFFDGTKIIANTEEETEEDLLNKIEKRREVIKMPDIPVEPPHGPHGPHDEPPPHPHHGHRPPPPHHMEIMEALRRIEERLGRIEERLG